MCFWQPLWRHITNKLLNLFDFAMCDSVPCHVPFWQKGQRFFKQWSIGKTFQVATLSLSLTFAAPTYANTLDTLIRILLPSYKKEKTAPTATPIPTPNANAQDDTVMTDGADLDVEQYIDDGTDDAFITSDETAPNWDLLPDFLRDDVLDAPDSLPMLGEPDLYALLSAEFSADRGEPQKALTIYKAESFKKNATDVFERALALSIEYEEPSQSLAFASAWRAKNPDHIPAWFYVAHLALKAKDYKQAVQMLSLILEYDNRADLTQILTGIVPSDPSDQQALFVALSGVDDDNPSMSLLRAGLLMRLGDYPPALLHVNKALKVQPKNPAYIALKLDLLKAIGQNDELWKFVHQKRKEMPQDAELYLYEVRHLINSGDLSQAWELLLVAYQNTKSPDVALLTALVGLDTNQYDKAIDVLTPLTQNNEFASRAHYYLGIGYERKGDVVNARHHYERVSSPEQVLDARTKVVGFYLLDNDVDKAIATLIRLRDDYEMFSADSYILQAEILIRQGNKQGAEDLLSSANRDYPDDDRLLFASFKMLQSDLSAEDKRSAIDKLLQIDPYNLEYQLADARLRLSQDANNQEALQAVKNISQLSVNDPSYDSALQLDALMILAENALALGNYTAVIDYLQTPYDVEPNLQVGILLLRAYQGLGQNDKVMGMLADLQSRFAFGKNNIDDIQGY